MTEKRLQEKQVWRKGQVAGGPTPASSLHVSLLHMLPSPRLPLLLKPTTSVHPSGPLHWLFLLLLNSGLSHSVDSSERLSLSIWPLTLTASCLNCPKISYRSLVWLFICFLSALPPPGCQLHMVGLVCLLHVGSPTQGQGLAHSRCLTVIE